jgi:hypothetical protein
VAAYARKCFALRRFHIKNINGLKIVVYINPASAGEILNFEPGAASSRTP